MHGKVKWSILSFMLMISFYLLSSDQKHNPCIMLNIMLMHNYYNYATVHIIVIRMH